MLQAFHPLLSVLPRLWPPRCLLCGAPGNGGRICDGCYHDLPHLHQACHGCARPLASNETTCAACQRRPLPFARVVAPFTYALPIDRLIHGFKYHARLSQGRLLSELLLRELHRQRDGAATPQAIVPVPLHPSRQRWRGFNQAIELARPLARETGIPLLPKLIRRTRATPEQVNLDAPERRRNLRGAFAAHGDSPSHVAIVDDVMTTGSTASEIARILHKAGATRVELWCVARVV